MFYRTNPKKADEIEKLFDSISNEYDYLNKIITFGTDAKNKEEIAKIINEKKPRKILDLATGTGDIPISLSKIKNCEIIGVDISKNMIAFGKKKIKRGCLSKKIILKVANAEKLKYGDNNFDVVTIGFGVRNFKNLNICLSEAYRVLKNSGYLIIYETSLPNNKIVRYLYYIFSSLFIPLVGLLFSKNPKAYFYLQKSSKVFPSGKNFLKILSKFGFYDFEIKTKLFGALSIYIAKK
tara:strand:+ start:758 stop:1468 length:711 start_codon:yes stop_codon:yes gene_type:complete